MVDWLNLNFETISKKKNIFLEFIQDKEIEYEKYIIQKLKNSIPWFEIDNNLDITSKCKLTSKMMKEGIDMILNPFFLNKSLKICGNPKLIIRMDKVNTIFNYQLFKPKNFFC